MFYLFFFFFYCFEQLFGHIIYCIFLVDLGLLKTQHVITKWPNLFDVKNFNWFLSPPRFSFLRFSCILRLKRKQTWVLSSKNKSDLGFLLAFRIHFYPSSKLDASDVQVAVIMLERLLERGREKERKREWKTQNLRENS